MIVKATVLAELILLIKNMEGRELIKYLTSANDETAGVITKKTKNLMSKLVRQALNSSKYQFERGDNL